MSEQKLSDFDGVSAGQILKERARALARKPRNRAADGEAFEVIEFRLAQEHYAVERQHVREVCPLRELTALPCTPPFVVGIINLRGQILPVIDIKKFFELPQTGITDLHLVVVVHADDIEVGILADAVIGVRSVPLSAIQGSLPTLTGIRAQYLKGVTDQHTVVLDVPRMLADQKFVVNEEGATSSK